MTSKQPSRPSREGKPNWLNPREMKAWRTYITTAHRLFDAMEADLDSQGLSLADYEVMARLSEAEGRSMRMTELADIALISKSRLSHRMKVLEKAGWVKRVPCTEDRRGSWAVMTEKGWKVMVKVAPIHLESIRNRFVDHLTSKDQEDLAKIFDRVHTQLREQFLHDNKW